MKKRLFSLVTMAALSVSMLAGCSSNGGTAKGEDGKVKELKEPVTIEMWHYMTGKQSDVLNEIVTEFNKTNGKGITVKEVPQGSIQDLNKKVIAASQSNTLPAIINVYPDVATGLIDQNKIVDLSTYINDTDIGMKDDLKNDFIPSFIEELQQWDKNKIYGIPMTKSTEVVYVNKNKLEQLGYKVDDLKNLTVEKLVEISKKSKEQLGIPGFGFDSLSNAFISTLKSDGRDFVDLESKIDIDNAWVKDFMEKYKQDYQNGYFRVAGEDKFLSGPFSNGNLLMYQGSTAGYSHIKTNGAFDVAVVEVPVFQGKDKAVIQQGASLFATADVSPEAQYAAYEFMKFATNKENTAKFATATGYLPVRKSANDTDAVKKILADKTNLYANVYETAQKALEYSYYTPAINNAQSARNEAAEKFEAYVTGKIKDIDTFIKDLKTSVETSIQRQ